MESPNEQIYNFKGSFYNTREEIFESLRLENTLWANMRIASGLVVALVIYTGKETRI